MSDLWKMLHEMEEQSTPKLSKLEYSALEYGVDDWPKLSDIDMIELHIDIALMKRDEEEFRRLMRKRKYLKRKARKKKGEGKSNAC